MKTMKSLIALNNVAFCAILVLPVSIPRVVSYTFAEKLL
jgi:hypothetical protein